jgi:hypothetical protein
MKRTDSLLKKAEVFEKLAVYGDRSNFLKSLSQGFSDPNAPTSFPGDVDAPAVDEKASPEVAKILGFVARILEKYDLPRKNVGDVSLFNRKPNMSGISQEINTALMTGGISPLTDDWKYLSYAQKKLFPTKPSDQSGPSAAPAVEYPSIEKNKQEALSRITTIEGLGLPLKIDGKLGPATRAALDAFKKKFDSTLSDPGALRKALDMVKTVSKYKLHEEF